MATPDPDLDRAVRRTPPHQLQRVLLGYLATALALLCGVPALVIGWYAASNCDLEGFGCLGYAILGLLAFPTVAIIALPFIAWRLRLGVWFTLLTIALVAGPIFISGGDTVFAGTAFLAPGLAAWVSDPVHARDLNPLAPPPEPVSPARHWGPRFVSVIVVAILIPLLGQFV